MKIKKLIAPFLLLPVVSHAADISVCDINMGNSYNLKQQYVEIVAAQQTYRISDSTQLTVNGKAVSLSGQNEQQVQVLNKELRELLGKVLQRELISAKHRLSGEVVQLIDNEETGKIDLQALDQLITQNISKLDSVIGGDESHLSYSPIKVDEKLELLHKEFVNELTKLPETYGENDRSSRNTINRINSQLTEQSEHLQLLNSDICQLTADISEKSEQLKTNLPELKSMELVTIKQLTL